ncbi:hypothetical protein Misp01_66200 [Microtetraspora sp. NBRC 13810]|uniref:hypothetical protein n=1 Tax=Microtetraspora sp. NBRC 13810 TaxID=3030990 RepID=UPI0024A18ACB|nr:hypothetical protein [Microtetraspora sp. NBRC 13810]GLW11492.1 hypothetical protein Misp01_66200 [Microtetraspora sp. NBRC 13810]
MTTLRDQLTSIATAAPTVDLTEGVIRKARRRRAGTHLTSAATAVAVVAALTFAVTGGQRPGDVIMSKVTDTLPAAGVGPLAYAYYDWCGEEWKPGVNTRRFAKECAQWNVVTRTGHTYRMPEALSVYTEQSAENYMNTNAPMVISANGERVVYYSEQDQKIAVRDLESGRVWLIPGTVSRAELVAAPMLLMPSPDGSRLGVWGRSGQDMVVEVETGKVTEIPEGWHVRAVGDGGAPVIVSTDKDDKLGVLAEDGTVRAFPPLKHTPAFDLSLPSPDGRKLAYLTGMTGVLTPTSDPAEKSKPNDTIVTLDTATGETLRPVRLRDVPPGFAATRAGGWLSPTEVVVSGPAMASSQDVTPVLGEQTYSVDIRTGKVTPLASHTYRAWAGSLELPGF